MSETPTATVTKYGDRISWLKARQKGIGASDTPAILGISKWGSPLTVWENKVSHIDLLEDQSDFFRRRSNLEKIVAAEYKYLHQDQGRIVKNPGTYAIHRHSEHPWLQASLDREVHDPKRGWGVLECKTANSFRRGEWDDPDEPPLDYLVQVQHQMLVSGYTWGSLCVMLGLDEFRTYDIDFEPDFAIVMLERLKAFWGYVERAEVPPVDSTKATENAIKRLWPIDSGETIELPQDAATWDTERLNAIDRLKAAENDKRYYENLLKTALGEAAYGTVGNVQYSHKTQTRKISLSVDEEHADALQAAGIPFKATGGAVYRVLRRKELTHE